MLSMENMKNKNKPVSWLFHVAGKKKIWILILSMIQILHSGCGVVLAVVLKEAVDQVVAGSRDGFYRMSFTFIGILVFSVILTALNRQLDEFTAASFENQFKGRLFAVLLHKDYDKIVAKHSGEWMNRLTSDTGIVADGLTHILPGLSAMLVKLLGALFLILMYLPKLVYILIPGAMVALVVTYALRRKMKMLHRRVQKAQDRLQAYLQENLQSLLVIRSFVKEKAVSGQSARYMDGHKKSRMQRIAFSNLCNTGMLVVIHLLYLLCIGYCCFGILEGTITYGTLLAMMQLVGQIQDPIANISGYMPKWYGMVASAERLMEAESYSENREASLEISEIRSFYENELVRFGLEHVTFSYSKEGDMALCDQSMEIQKGEFVAITGDSGCGKSTMLKLLLGLYPLEQGMCFIETQDGTMKMSPKYRRLFAYVPQGNHLMSGTIEQVVSFGEPEPDPGKIENALEVACALDFVKNLPEGIQTSLLEGGAGLSEGQMQRIAVARAIYSDCPVLLLDESTSALDENTERQLLENLRKMTDKTVVIVTHRKAALTFCDRCLRV